MSSAATADVAAAGAGLPDKMPIPDGTTAGTAGQNRGLSFDPATLNKVDFDPDVFSQELRAKAPIDTLKRDLQAYLQQLKTTLVDLINRDYSDLVNMSTNLVGIDAKITQLSRPLEILREQIAAAHDESEGSASELGALCDSREEVARDRVVLQFYVQIADTLAGVDRLWESLEQAMKDPAAGPGGGGGGSGIGLRPPLHYLSRISTQLNGLEFVCGRCSEDSRFIAESRRTLDAHTKRLVAELDDRLQTSLASSDAESATLLLRAYSTVHQEAAAERLYNRKFVEPFMAEAVARASAGDDPAIPAGALALDKLYADVLQFVKSSPSAELLEISSTLSAVDAGASKFDFISSSVWAAVFEAAKGRMYQPASSGFQKSYLHTMAFVEDLEKSFRSIEGITQFREHPTTQTFDEKWKVHLKTYFQIFKNDMIESVEDCLSDSSATTRTEAPADFLYNVSSKVLRCWSPDVFIQPLAPEFLRISLQLIARFASWVNDGLECRRPDANATPDEAAATATTASGEAVLLANAAAAAAAAAAASGLASWAGLPPSEHVFVYADAQLFIQRVRKELIGVTAVKFDGDDAKQLVAEVVGDAVLSLEKTAVAMGKLIASQVGKSCTEGLDGQRGVKSILAMYRAQNRGVPTTNSPFVDGALEPLSSLTDRARGIQHVPEAAVAEWADFVVGIVCQRFLEAATEVVTSAKKTAAGLDLIKSRRKKPAASAAGDVAAVDLTDTEKICVQIWLDVRAFGLQIVKLGGSRSGHEQYTALEGWIDSELSANANVVVAQYR